MDWFGCVGPTNEICELEARAFAVVGYGNGLWGEVLRRTQIGIAIVGEIA
jgi:hypothetical protein